MFSGLHENSKWNFVQLPVGPSYKISEGSNNHFPLLLTLSPKKIPAPRHCLIDPQEVTQSGAESVGYKNFCIDHACDITANQINRDHQYPFHSHC